MKNTIIFSAICSSVFSLPVGAAETNARFDASAKELKAILDVPALGDLLNGAAIESIQMVQGTTDTFEVDAGFCKARVRVVKADSKAAANPHAESLGAECGP